MIGEMWNLFTSRFSFFAGLLAEHIEISLLAILIAIFAGALAGILISEFQRFAKPTLGVINFLYTIPSISMLGFLIPFSGVGNATAVIALTVCAASDGAEYTYGDHGCGPGDPGSGKRHGKHQNADPSED